VQSHVLLRRPRTEELVAGFTRHTGAVGRAVLAFADGAGISPDRATRALHDYLTTSGGLLLDDDRREHGLLARERILERLERA
jgi:hypothetical protein